ncbi:AAA family ATPase [Aquimarina muelleri]|uniref:ATPase n=1 Tax=Aquimarina muelleri TaxID=279356 RepID=A0A918N272_9FLAO|nr:ATP-binding protein [Aquimarina muelleri]MCX2761734.1 ATP-binding protein [Aquimarina muelleri]GGX15776.1 ATPase [Aquimarina muelleri]
MANKKIVIIGGPSTGKTTIIKHLEFIEEICLHEISRQVTQEAQQQGIDQLFLKNPLLFSQKLIEGRIKQYTDATKISVSRIFFDRGIPDVIAYMNYINKSYPSEFMDACEKYKYDHVFLLPPWEDIHKTDNERYESFDQAQRIHHHLYEVYSNFGYHCIEVPFGNVKERSDFILQNVL